MPFRSILLNNVLILLFFSLAPFVFMSFFSQHHVCEVHPVTFSPSWNATKIMVNVNDRKTEAILEGGKNREVTATRLGKRKQNPRGNWQQTRKPRPRRPGELGSDLWCPHTAQDLWQWGRDSRGPVQSLLMPWLESQTSPPLLHLLLPLSTPSACWSPPFPWLSAHKWLFIFPAWPLFRCTHPTTSLTFPCLSNRLVLLTPGLRGQRDESPALAGPVAGSHPLGRSLGKLVSPEGQPSEPAAPWGMLGSGSENDVKAPGPQACESCFSWIP